MLSFATMLGIKRFIATFLLVGVLTNCFNYLLVQESYKFNKEYISSVLCSNKDKPHLHCDGKCFLDIKLKELDQKNKSEQENLKRIIETVEPTSVSLLHPVLETFIQTSTSPYLQRKPIGISVAIFHPPQFA